MSDSDSDSMDFGDFDLDRKPSAPTKATHKATRKPKSFKLEDAMIIAVMGATGAGKSRFIRTLTGDDSVVVGDNLKSETVDVNPVWCIHPKTGKEVVLLDTPGFADTERSDTDILQTIANWLKQTYEKRATLAGILYLHRISDNRVTNVSVTNLKMLKELCGKESLANVVFVTTMWSKEDRSIAEKRQEQLEQTFWKSMIKLRAQVARFGDTYEDGWSIIDKLKSRPPRPLKLQKEMVDEGKELAETAAGGEIDKKIKELMKEHEAKMKQLTDEAETARIAGEAKMNAALEKEERAEAAEKRAEEAVKRAQTEAEKAAAQAKLDLALERAKRAEERAEEERVAIAAEREMWLEEQRKAREKEDALARDAKKLHESAPTQTDINASLVKAKAEGQQRPGFFKRVGKAAWDGIGKITRADGWSIINKFKSRTPHVPELQETTPKSEFEFLKNAMIIAVMGATGAGKSSFIRTLTGDNSVKVGHNLESETIKVNAVRCRHPEGKDVVFLDTPGFADTNRTDTEILQTIANWLNATYADGIKLAGILYLHRISDNRVTNVSVTNLKMLRKLCGTDSLKNVIFVTTMWGKEDKVKAERRQAQLEQSYWKDMIDLGAQVARFGDTRGNGWSIIDKLEFTTPCVLKIQKEMVDDKKKLADTAAGGEVEKQLNKLREEHERKEKELKAQAEEARKEGEAAKKAADERAKRAEADKKRAEEAAKRAQIDGERANAAALAKLELAKKKMEKAEEDAKAAMNKEQKMWLEEQRKSAEADKKRAEEEAKSAQIASERSNTAALAQLESATKQAKEAEELAKARQAAMEKEQKMWRDEQRKAEEAAQRAKRESEQLNEGGFWNGLGKVCMAVGQALP